MWPQRCFGGSGGQCRQRCHRTGPRLQKVPATGPPGVDETVFRVCCLRRKHRGLVGEGEGKGKRELIVQALESVLATCKERVGEVQAFAQIQQRLHGEQNTVAPRDN